MEDRVDLGLFSQPAFTCLSMSRYTSKRKIGNGAFANVYKAQLADGDLVAVKEVKISGCDEADREAQKCFENEVIALDELDHPNVVAILHANVFPKKFIIELELLDSDLHGVLTSAKVDDETVDDMFRQLLCGVAFVHQAGFAHRDLKPSNILVSPDHKIKIADFGCAVKVPEEGIEYAEKVVTRWYRAPELLIQLRFYDETVDLWSLGCIYYEMKKNCVLFPGNCPPGQLLLILKLLGYPNHWTAFNERLSGRIAFEDFERQLPEWADMNMQVLKGLIEYVPEERLTASQALEILNQQESTSE